MMKRFALWRCHFLGWHPSRCRIPVPGHERDISEHMRCTRCGFEGMVDSQGNLF